MRRRATRICLSGSSADQTSTVAERLDRVPQRVRPKKALAPVVSSSGEKRVDTNATPSAVSNSPLCFAQKERAAQQQTRPTGSKPVRCPVYRLSEPLCYRRRRSLALLINTQPARVARPPCLPATNLSWSRLTTTLPRAAPISGASP